MVPQFFSARTFDPCSDARTKIFSSTRSARIVCLECSFLKLVNAQIISFLFFSLFFGKAKSRVLIFLLRAAVVLLAHRGPFVAQND